MLGKEEFIRLCPKFEGMILAGLLCVFDSIVKLLYQKTSYFTEILLG